MLTYYKLLEIHANKGENNSGLRPTFSNEVVSERSSHTVATKGGHLIQLTSKDEVRLETPLRGSPPLWRSLEESKTKTSSIVIFQINMLITNLLTFAGSTVRPKVNNSTRAETTSKLVPEIENNVYFWSEASVHHKYAVAYKSIINNMFIQQKDKDDIEQIFHMTQRNYLALKRFINIYRYKKSIIKIHTDLCLNTIDLNNKKNICIILQNKIKYVFTLPDIQNILMTSITHHNSFFPEPHMPRNPYTNIPLTKADIYNIYFTILESRRITPPLLTECFLNNFDMELFLVNNEAKLRDYSIKDYVTNSPYTILYPEVMYMVRKYFKNTQIIEYCEKNPKSKTKKIIRRNVNVKLMIHPEFPRDVLVDIMRPYLYLYILSYDSIDGTEKRTIANRIFKHQKNKFMKYNYKFGRKHISITNNTHFSRFKGERPVQDPFYSSLFCGQNGGASPSELGPNNSTRVYEESRAQEQRKYETFGEVCNRQKFNNIHENLTMFQVEKMLSTKYLTSANINNDITNNSDVENSDDEFINYYSGERSRSTHTVAFVNNPTTNSEGELGDHVIIDSDTESTQSSIVDQDGQASPGSLGLLCPEQALLAEDTGLNLYPEEQQEEQPEEFMNNVPPADDILLSTPVNVDLFGTNLSPEIDQTLRMYEESAIEFLSYVSDNESTGYDSNS